MNERGKWLEEVIAAMTALGGHASLEELYDEIRRRNSVEFTATWDATVRRTIEMHSQDSKVFRGQPEHHLFYSVDGTGKGHWGLVNYPQDPNKVDLTEDPLGFPEGRKRLRQHLVRERNPRVIRLAKERFKADHGRLFCQVCGFDFTKRYGSIGADYIEGHHTVPVSELVEGHETKVDDIALVCSNCHRMLHKKRPWLKIDELEKLIEA